jgi:hypothetical protein
MYRHEVFEAMSGDYLGEFDLDREILVGEGLANTDGRVFRVVSMSVSGPSGNCLRRVEVAETVDTAWVARLECQGS